MAARAGPAVPGQVISGDVGSGQAMPGLAAVTADGMMLGGLGETARRRNADFAVYGLLAAFLLIVAAVGQVGLGLARPLFIAGCMGVAWQARRVGGLALHVEVTIVLFVFAPFIRRIIDLHVGYDPSATILVGPLLAVTVTLPELKGLLVTQTRSMAVFMPYLLMLVCIMYGWAISAFEGNLLFSSIIAVKYLVPLFYSVCLILHPEESEAVLLSATKTFLLISPVIGLYGIWQYLDPQPWDTFWMISSQLPAIGDPVSGKVRVFSTMNSPVSFAAYATCGLLLTNFARKSVFPPILVPFVAIVPLGLAILLTGVRTAWLSACAALLFCLLFNRTRNRATVLIGLLAAGVTVALLFTSFGDSIGARLDTVNNASADGSGNARMSDYMHVFGGEGHYTFGSGLAPLEADAELGASDGQILLSALQMGTVFGLIHVMAIIWASLQVLFRIGRSEDPLRLVAAAVVVGNVVILPLLAVTVGEIAFLFWMLVGVLTVAEPAVVVRRMS